MEMTHTKTLLTALASGAALVSAMNADAAAIIYEPFNYSAGTINGTQGPATGLTGQWTQSGGSGLFEVVSSGLDFTGLATTGGAAKRNSAPGGSEISIAVESGTAATLTPDNGTIYFSLLLRNDRHSVGNEGMTFVFGTDKFDVISPDNVNPTISGGEGFGVHMDGLGDSTMDIFGYAIDGGVAAESIGKVDNDTSVNTFFIVGQIDWVESGNDTLTLYNVSDVNTLPVAFATITADIDQSAFDTLAITNRQVSTIDEIRFGTSLADVGVVPEPGSLALLAAGGLLVASRRRRG